MNSLVSEEEQIRRLAVEQVAKAKTLRAHAHEQGADVGFDATGMAWLDGFVTAERDSGDQGRSNSAYWHGGAFYGECLIRLSGGRWFLHDDMTMMVRFDERNGTFPFNTVLKQLDGEEGASVEGAFQGAMALFGASANPRELWLGQSREWWGGLMAVDDEVTRNFTPRSGTANEIIDGAFNIVRHGDARAVTINSDLSGVSVSALVDEYNTNWAPKVAANDLTVICGYTSDPAVSIDVFGEGQRALLVDQPNPTPSMVGRDNERF